MTNKFWLINLVLFQLVWFSCALLTVHAGWISFVILLIHFALSPNKKSDAKLLLLVPVGICSDFLLFKLGIIDFAMHQFPIWLIFLWAMFALSINHSLLWLQKLRLWQVGLIGSVGGATSYLAATKFDAIISNITSVQLLLVYGVIWAIIMPLMIVFQRKFVLANN